MKKRIISLIMVFVLCIASFAIVNPFETKVKAATQSELQSKIDSLDSQIKEYKSKLSELEDDKEENEEYLETLENQIAAQEEKAAEIQTQIETLNTEIDGYNSQIKQLNKEIKTIKKKITKTETKINKTKEDINNTKDGLENQLKIDYMKGKDSTLKILMGSDSLASFLTSLELMKKTSEAENKVINNFRKKVTEYKEDKQELEDSKTELKDKKSEVSKAKKTAVKKKAELVKKQKTYKAAVSDLEENYTKIDTYIAELDRDSAIYKSYVSSAEKAKEEADAELDKVISRWYATSTSATTAATTLYAANNDTTKSSSSGSGSGSDSDSDGTTAAAKSSYSSSASWGWPLGNTSCYISSGFGYRSASISGNAFHGGIDITGGSIYGKPVYATRAGTVVTAVYGTTGYGRYVVIDHGDGFTSIYGHCSNLCVSAGQTVSKGQQIAYVGSTGNSTGPHLHFEVRKDGTKVNPLNYVSKP